MSVERLITASVRSTFTLTIDPALSNTVTVGDTYQLSPLRRDEIVRAITRAVRRAGSDWLAVKLDETGTFFTGIQTYALPADCMTLLNVWIWNSLTAPANTIDPQVGGWVPFNDYEVVGGQNGGALQLRGWQANVAVYPGYAIKRKIEYVGLPTQPGVSDNLGLSAATEREAVSFVEQYALAMLHQEAVGANPTGDLARIHNTLYQQYVQEAARIMQEREPLRATRRMVTMSAGRQR